MCAAELGGGKHARTWNKCKCTPLPSSKCADVLLSMPCACLPPMPCSYPSGLLICQSITSSRPAAAVMASSTILSPRPLDLAPAASLSELDQFCSGPLDSFLEEATRFIKRSPMQQRSGHSSSKGVSSHKRAASGSGKPNKAGAVKKAQVSAAVLDMRRT